MRRRVRAIAVGALVVALLVGVAQGEHHIVRAALRPAPAAAQAPAGSVVPSSRCPWVASQTMSVPQRVKALEAAMTKPDLANLLYLQQVDATDSYEAWTSPEPSVCLPSLTETDARIGVHSFGWDNRSTLLPAPIAVASSFAPSLAATVGRVIGSQSMSQGVDFASAPMVNIPRGSDFGRTSETLSEDPYLAATLGAQEVTGIQSQHVGAILQHYGVYSSADGRARPGKSNSIVSQVAMQEVYLAPFQAIVRATSPAGVMMAYTSINGIQAVDDVTLHDYLVDWSQGPPPFTRSDCLLFPDDQPAMIASGLSQSKCGPNYVPSYMVKLSRSTLDRLATPFLTAAFRLGLIQHPLRGRPGNVSAAQQAEGRAVSLQASEDGTVLLKNNAGILPLSTSTTVALIGSDRFSQSEGSLKMPVPTGTVDDAQGLAKAWGHNLTYVPIPDSAQPPGPAVPSGESITPAVIGRAVAAARRAQVAIVVASEWSSEWWDHTTLALPTGEVPLIEAVAKANPRTIVVANDGGAFLTAGWGQRVKAIVDQWYPGEQAGNALAAILTGQVNPSGKLPITFPTSDSAQPAPSRTPQMDPVGDPGPVLFGEGVDVGYRWYVEHHVVPAYPFGFGLSYSDLRIRSSELEVGPDDAVTVSATVANQSARPGTQVVQVYLTKEPAGGQPPIRLLGFARVAVGPHGQGTATIRISPGDLSHWTAKQGWVVTAGAYRLEVGTSSDSLPMALTAHLAALTKDLHGITVAG